jgi:hypothetical protein
MSTSTSSAEEILWSINGFDKIAIQVLFGMSLADIQKMGDDSELIRALAFIDMRRSSLSDQEAHKAAMELTIRQLTEYFPEPDAESGKDSTA